MKLTLIQPAMGRESAGYVRSWQMEPLSIAALKALTPPDVEVDFFDDRVELIDYDAPTDAVAITAETYTARRAFQIARAYRERDIPVIMGGYHATLMPDEVAEHADAIVTGDAEPVWAKVLGDAERRQLEPRYVGNSDTSLELVKSDRSIFAGKRYLPLTLIEAGRGCKFACDFCSIAAFTRNTYRWRPPSDVAAEIEAAGRKRIFLVDDNVVAEPERTKELLRALAPLGINWLGQGSLQVADDPELLDLLEKSGCVGLLIGFESLNEEVLRSMNKRFNKGPGRYAQAIAKLRDHGMKLYATFVFGYDQDGPEVFERTLEFAMEQRFMVAAFNHLQPFPGTPLYERLAAEGRLLFDKWWLEPGYRFGRIAFRPRQLEPDELFERLMDTRRQFFSIGSIVKRGLDFKANSKDPFSAWIHLTLNAMLRRELKQKWALPLGDLTVAEPS